MRILKTRTAVLAFYFLAVLYIGSAYGQAQQSEKFRYISPKPGSKYILPGNNIALRHGDVLDKGSVAGFELDVTGSISGRVEGKVVLSDDERTLLFYPETPFQLGEEVHVTTSSVVETKSNRTIEPVDFAFTITAHIPEMPENFVAEQEFMVHQSHFPKHYSQNSPVNKQAKVNNLPEDFPDLAVEILNETFDNGYYFISPFGYWGWYPDNIPYLIAFDDHGVPVFYERQPEHAYDFKPNVNGLLSHLTNTWPTPYFRILNASYEAVDQYTMQNGYSTDFHEFFFLENGHAFIMSYDPQLVDMSQIVPGGQEDAIVTGWVFQELDANKNVVFQWRSWDHYDITDCEGSVDLTASVVDYVHGNAIELSPDGQFLYLSPRNFDEITKIDRNTGEILWRLNGNNNMFEFTNDTLRFHKQHDCRILENGNLSIFDNGEDYPGLNFSSMVEYELDEENFTATLVRRLRNDPDIFGVIMGSAREVHNGNIVVGWGSGEPAVTEFNAAGEIASVYSFAGINYRAYRYHWTTDYFELNQDELNYGYIWQEDTKTKIVKVLNNQDVDIQITSHHLQSDKFVVETEFPFTVLAGGHYDVHVTFDPGEQGTFTDRLTLNSDINSDTLVQRIAQQVDLLGHSTEGQGVDDHNSIQVTASPNPVADVLTLTFSKNQEKLSIRVLNSTGQQVKVLDKINTTDCLIDMSKLPVGIYFIEIRNQTQKQIRNLKIIKD